MSIEDMTLGAASTAKAQNTNALDTRRRILDAAFALFTDQGFSQTSTLEIAKRAKVSKRDLYVLVGKKEDMLRSCITERSTRLRWPQNLPPPNNRTDLIKGLEKFGYQVLKEATDPVVVSVFRLAMAETERTPEVAHALESVARATVRGAIHNLFKHAKASGIVQGDTADMTSQYSALLWGDLMLTLLLRSANRPNDAAMKKRAYKATIAIMKLYGTA